ncbi:SDR family oxidoreductase [Brevibacillus dissolubilis]|uniref:SDR family oxidoreductase n=1 Tax=Brevibacillus dissolubilis TaxID=1844116 RepID=UPI001116B83D|nr:SDR family oxidoreductase [Brevibacillus dissolubilis]
MRKSVFVTGATGFVGKQLINDLVRQGHHVYALVRGKSGQSASQRLIKLVPPGYAHLVTGVEGDLNVDKAGISDAQLDELADKKIDLFIHSAAVVMFDEKYRDQHQSVNVEGSRRAVRMAKQLNIPQFYHISTAYTVGDRDEAFEELHPLLDVFQNNYERTKCITEHYISEQVDENLNVAIFRPSIIAGHSITGEAETNISVYGFLLCVKRFMERLDEQGLQRSYRVVANPNAGMNIVPVDQVSRAMLLAMEQGVKDGIYHITNPELVPVPAFFRSICQALGVHENFLVATKDLTSDQMTKEEKFLNRLTSTFHAYFTHGPRFDNRNMVEIFRKAGKTYRSLDEKQLSFILSRYGGMREPVLV